MIHGSDGDAVLVLLGSRVFHCFEGGEGYPGPVDSCLLQQKRYALNKFTLEWVEGFAKQSHSNAMVG